MRYVPLSRESAYFGDELCKSVSGRFQVYLELIHNVLYTYSTSDLECRSWRTKLGSMSCGLLRGPLYLPAIFSRGLGPAANCFCCYMLPPQSCECHRRRE